MLDNQSSLLYRLQTLDISLAQRQNRLNEINTLLGDNVQVKQARQDLDAAEQALAPWQTRVRNLDLEIKSIAQKTTSTEQHLYSGRVSNTKEMTDMQQEIVSLKKRQSLLEDEMLEAMLQVEEGQAAVSTAKRALESAQASWTGSQTDLLGEKQRLEGEVAALKLRRQQAASEVDPAALAKYEALRPKKRGQAVALIQGDSCIACGVEQTSRSAQLVRQGAQLVYCESCGRILATA